jgi:hypothetical protein
MTKSCSHIECMPTDMEWIPAYMETVPGLKHHGATRWYHAPAFTE